MSATSLKLRLVSLCSPQTSIDVDRSNVGEDGDGGHQGDIHIVVLGSGVQYVGGEVIRESPGE